MIKMLLRFAFAGAVWITVLFAGALIATGLGVETITIRVKEEALSAIAGLLIYHAIWGVPE